LQGVLFPLEELDLSGNFIGKTPVYFQKVVPEMIAFLGHFARLTTFKISHNHMRGGQGNVEPLLKCFADCASLKHLDLSNNLLG
jgi:Ran GTPase-activating protein (RanGAP) involved in mRNA processing and transport